MGPRTISSWLQLTTTLSVPSTTTLRLSLRPRYKTYSTRLTQPSSKTPAFNWPWYTWRHIVKIVPIRMHLSQIFLFLKIIHVLRKKCELGNLAFPHRSFSAASEHTGLPIAIQLHVTPQFSFPVLRRDPE